ncbi:MAG: hypothetical protein GXP62_13205, partial [Oligoflexia bacterium]|nr:hypothetical protein [Oligoflexia bacterium]
YARGSLAGFTDGVLLASPQSDQVEQLWAPAAGCGQDLDTSPLVDAGLADVMWNSSGNACAAPGLKLDLSASPPTLERSGLSLDILALSATDLGIWVTVSAQGEGLHGLRLTVQTDGSLIVRQRLGTDLASETLLRADGQCAKQKPHPRRRRKPGRPGPDRRLPR